MRYLILPTTVALMMLVVTANADHHVTYDTGDDAPHENMQPFLAVNHIISLEQGQITLFAGNSAPSGWELCDGQ